MTEGVVPAERRARCAAHPKLPSETTCRGCGLFLCSECARPEGDPRCPRCSAEGHPIAWEDPKVGRIRAFFRTLKFMSTPKGFWAAMPWTGGIKGPLIFGVLAGCIGALGKALYVVLSGLFVASDTCASWINALYAPVLRDSPRGRALLADLPSILERVGDALIRTQGSQLLTAPLEAAFELFVIAALTHPLARWLGGQGTFEATFRVMAYAAGAQVIKLVPGLGIPFAFLAGVMLVVGGMRRAHGLSGGRALVTALWWIPVALLLFCMISAWLFTIMVQVLGGG